MADRMVEITQTGACSYAGNYEYYRQEKAKRAAMPIAPAQETEKKTERRWETNTAPAKPAATGSGRNQYRQKQLEQEIRMRQRQELIMRGCWSWKPRKKDWKTRLMKKWRNGWN